MKCVSVRSESAQQASLATTPELVVEGSGKLAPALSVSSQQRELER